MRTRTRSAALIAAACLGATLLVATPARADHHFISIVEVFAGTGDHDDAEYVELQMYSAGQQFVGAHRIRVYDAGGAAVATHTFPADVATGTSQATVLLASTDAETLFNVSDDFPTLNPATLGLTAAGGKVCFESTGGFGTIDCVAWGDYSGSSAGVGSPFSPSEGIPSGASIGRELNANNTLESTDDTDDSADDFRYVTPSPDPNGVLPAGSADGGSLNLDTVSPWSATEAPADISIDVERTGGTGTVGVGYNTVAGSATADVDYEQTTGAHSFTNADPQTTNVALLNDPDCERTETFRLRIRNPTGGAVLGPVNERTAQILDDDAPDDGCYFLQSTTYQANEGGAAEVVIVRMGDLSTVGSSVRFTTTAGTASAGEFVNWNDAITFGNNVGFKTVVVQLPEDSVDEPNETFSVTLSNAQPGSAIVGTPSTATVTILDDDEFKKPVSRITRPDHGNSYRRGRLVDLVGTASDTGGSGLKLVQVALRRKMLNGSCKWWTGSRWTSRSCTRKLFVKAAGRADWAYALNNLLPKSRGTSTRNYTLFSRATDKAGNVESRFTRDRNMNTFEII